MLIWKQLKLVENHWLTPYLELWYSVVLEGQEFSQCEMWHCGDGVEDHCKFLSKASIYFDDTMVNLIPLCFQLLKQIFILQKVQRRINSYDSSMICKWSKYHRLWEDTKSYCQGWYTLKPWSFYVELRRRGACMGLILESASKLYKYFMFDFWKI